MPGTENFPDFFGKNLVPRKRHSGMQTSSKLSPEYRRLLVWHADHDSKIYHLNNGLAKVQSLGLQYLDPQCNQIAQHLGSKNYFRNCVVSCK